jgi:hypothetical protein
MEDEEGDEDDDGEDSDYEYLAGDLAIYDSALDEVDELLYIKDTLERINQADPNYFSLLLSHMTPQEIATFQDNMQNAPALKDREEQVRKKCDELDS